MISKELISEVLGKEISDISIIGDKINYVVSNYETEEDGELVYINLGTNINIYELTHKCKEWSYDNFKHRLISGRSIGSDDGYVYFCTIYLSNSEHYGIVAKTEPEAIFKACEWILKQKENK